MPVPLIRDLRLQAPSVCRLASKTVLLLVLFVGLDRSLGWMLRTGLDRYYGLNEPAAVLCVGHSHTVLGVDKVYLEQALGLPVAKFAVEGANAADRLMMIQYYFTRQPKSLRAVVYDVDAHTFTGAGLSSSSYQLLFPFIDDPEMRRYLKQNCASRTEYVLRRLLCTTRYNELTISLAMRGYLKKWTNFKFGKYNIEAIRQQIREGRFRRIAFDKDSINLFEKTTSFVSSHGCTMFLAYIPTIDVFNGAEPEKFQHSVEMLDHYAATSPTIVFLDYNREYQSRHDLFFDSIHLNRDGQKEVTARLAQDLKRFLSNGGLAGVVDHKHSDPNNSLKTVNSLKQ
jgi:hypothetical protein